MKIIKTVQYKEAQVNLNYLSNFAMNLRTSVNNFASNINQYQTTEQALMELENIQSILQQIIASVQQGVRKTVVTNPQAIEQAKTPLAQ